MIKNASLGWFDRMLNKCEPNNYSSSINSKSRTRITQVESTHSRGIDSFASRS